jgi:hypothetical protein
MKSNSPKAEGKEICEVTITPSDEPMVVHYEGKQEFFVRVGNSSIPYSPVDFMQYWQQHRGKGAQIASQLSIPRCLSHFCRCLSPVT